MPSFDELYKLTDKKLGQGRFGVTRQALTISDSKPVAVKVIRRGDTKSERMIMKEIDIMKKCHHPHIVKFHDYHQDDRYHYIVMEYLPYGELFEYVAMGVLTVTDIKFIFAQLISAIEYCHGNLIAHRDLKLENIMVSNNKTYEVKIIDFGLASIIKTDSLHSTFCGSIEYAAPEIIQCQKYNPIKTDVWSLGVILYAMVTGYIPWSANNTRTDICNFHYDKECISSDVELMDLFSKVFVDSRNRVTISQLKKHPWISEHTLPSYLPSKEPIDSINPKLLDQMSCMGFNKIDVVTSLGDNNDTINVAIYHSLVEKSKKQPIKKRKVMSLTNLFWGKSD